MFGLENSESAPSCVFWSEVRISACRLGELKHKDVEKKHSWRGTRYKMMHRQLDKQKEWAPSFTIRFFSYEHKCEVDVRCEPARMQTAMMV